MDDEHVPYLGPALGNLDVLVLFIGGAQEPNCVSNVNPNILHPPNEHVVVDPNIVHPSNEPVVHEETINEEPNIVNSTPCPDEVYMSEEETILAGFGNGSSGSEYEPTDEEVDLDEEFEADCLSDFEETIDVIGNDHSDDDIEEIYVERGKLGFPFKRLPNGKIKLAKDQLFNDVKHFREILKDYSIQEGFQLYRVQNGKDRVTCECKAPGCTWRIHVSPTPDKVTFKIKTYYMDHTCIRTTKNTEANSKWIAQKLESLIMADPNISYSAMRQALLEKHGVEPTSNMQLYRAKRKVHQTTSGIHVVSYNDLPPWTVAVRHYNSGSIVKLSVEPTMVGMNPQFKRLFLCLDAQKKGFVRGCRPWFGIDGCHLKGPYGGILLSAVALDANNGMFPIAVGVVEIENKDSWMFFLSFLRQSLQSVPEWKDNKLTIMSDMQKGLGLAVAEIFPYAKHRFCANHMLNHFKTKFRSLMLTSQFWACVMAYNEFMFNKAIDAMRKTSKEAADWLLHADRPKHTWARHTFDPQIKSDHVTNNLCEVFNAWVGDDRKNTVLSMMESFISRLMVLFENRRDKAAAYKYNVTPRETQPLIQVGASTGGGNTTTSGAKPKRKKPKARNKIRDQK